MRLGATLVHLAEGPQFETAPWAERLVAAGFESLWTPHVVGRPGVFVPDPFVTVATAAAVTSGVEVGTATVQIPLFHPADLAHRVQSLQAVCGDRLTLGLSPGSSALDYAHLGRDHAHRFATFRANVPALRAAMTPPAPDVLLGTWGKNVERAAREFDGWLVSGHRVAHAPMVEALARFRAAGGRRAVVCTVPVDPDLDATAATLRGYAAAGFDDAVVLFAPGGPGPEDVRALL